MAGWTIHYVVSLCSYCSISIIKGQLTNERFQVNNEPIPTVLEKPIKSLGRWHSAELKDWKQVEQLRQDTISGLKKTNNTALPGKLKLWCFQFGLLPRLMLPISMRSHFPMQFDWKD